MHIDAGYLYATLATRETGSSNRAAITVDVPALVKDLIELATTDSGLRLLRVHWYDAAQDGVPDSRQRQIGMIDSVKLRMGRINPFGEQKGVDLRLGLDLVGLGVNSAAEVAYVVSGDDDLTEAVTDAQDLGLQVKLIAVPGVGDGRPMAVAGNLRLEVDGVLTIPEDVIARTVHRATRTVPTRMPPPAPADGGGATPAVLKPSAAAVVPWAARPPVVPPAPKPTVPVQVPAPAPGYGPTRVELVYSTRTGETSTGRHTALGLDVVEDVARSVVDVWVTTATAEEVAQVMASRPNIPGEIDRILLTDMVNQAGVDDLPQYVRFELRDAFWRAVTDSAHA